MPRCKFPQETALPSVEAPADESAGESVAPAPSFSQLKSDFLATISHEMRTPMQSVFGFLELMLLENPEPKLKSMIDRAMISASGVLEMLDDILDVAKIDADKMVLDEFEVPVRTLVRGVVEALQPRLQDKNIILGDEIAENVPKLLLGDPKRLRQILINLTGNAIKFTPQGHITIRVTRGANDEGPYLKFEVIDTGIGLSVESQKKLFQPFTQADQSTSRTYGGTGLGLSISSKLVQLMKGEIGVESMLDHGSNFWFRIPLHEVVEDSEHMARAQDAANAPLPDLTGLSILSIENHQRAAREIASTLQSLGAKVETTPSLLEARAMINYRPFDAVMSEQDLDDGRGIDFIRELAENNTNTGLMIYTASIDATLRQSLKTLGAAYLEKPASRRGLAMAVAQTVTRPAMSDPTPHPQKILIVEDNLSVIEILKRQMEVLGVTADFAGNGEEALIALNQCDYHLILTDLHMPKMDGYGLIREIRAQEKAQEKTQEKEGNDQPPPHQTVILLTADLQLSNYRAYMPLGFDECVIKPVTLGTMRQLFLRRGVAIAGMRGAHDMGAGHGLKATGKTAAKANDLRPTAQQEIFDKIDFTNQDDVAFDGDQKIGNMAENSAINMAILAEQMGPLDEGALDILARFPHMMQPILDQMNVAAKAKNWTELTHLAHSLKGAARSAGAMILGDIAAEIQQTADLLAKPTPESIAALKSHDLPAHLFSILDREFTRVKIAIVHLSDGVSELP
ncbi:MAG: response regulator [Alphaproteobacteria bacterium]|nr:response regulator [Alphaproteobacteria bacterium]